MIRKNLKTILALAAFVLAGNSTFASISLDEATLGDAVPASIGAYSMAADEECYYTFNSDHSKILKVAMKDGAESTIFDSASARGCKIDYWDGFTMGNGRILLYCNKQMIYRHSFKADYYIYEIRHNKLTKLSQAGGEEIATLSPDGSMVAYVKDGNVRLAKLAYETDIAVTTDGKENLVRNAVPDWVYQEEFGMLNSFAWAPDCLTLSFIRWDESAVKSYTLLNYRGACYPQEENALYPSTTVFKYPKAGQQNAIVSVLSYDVDNKTLKTMNIPMNEDGYVSQIAYAPGHDRLMVTTLNRNQNQMDIYAVNPRSAVAKSVYSEKSQSWIKIEAATDTHYYDDSFVVFSDKDGYAHLYQYSNAGALLKQVTKGEWDVTKFYGYNPATKAFYFQAAQPSALDRAIMKVDAKGITSSLSKGSGTYKADFSFNFNSYIQNFCDANTPHQYTVMNAITGKSLRTLESNSRYAEKYNQAYAPRREFFTLESHGYTLNGYMLKPLDFNPNKKYPVIVSQYSGPGSQQVLNKWVVDWENYAATQGYVVVCVDPRGTGGRGKGFESLVYMQLSKLETEDQIAVANYMARQSFVDAKHIGIWGWSYGGFETLHAMTTPGTPFCAGVAIAPVSDMRFYDTIYTERYMRTPQENAEGYDATSTLNKVENLKGRLLVMYGTSDDNVHPSNALEFAAQATAAGKTIDMMVYPNMNHSINYCDVRATLYKRVLEFFDANLKK